MTRASGTFFGDLIRWYLRQLGVSQQELADASRIDGSTMSHIIAGHRNPSRKTVEGMVTALGMDLREANRFRLAAGFAPEIRR